MNEIFWPVIALFALTACIWFLMCFRRISEILASRIDPQSLATNDEASAVLKNVSAAENLRNLLETPVLFYSVCLSLAITETVTQQQLTLAWIYFGLRVLHSLIHVTYNLVVHRFVLYFLSTLCLFIMWVAFAISLFSQIAA